MPVSLQELVDEIVPDRTILIFGAGASIPSGAPTCKRLIERISQEFKIDPDGLNLAEIAGLAERKRNRRDLIATLRREFADTHPRGAILNLPLYHWQSIFSTNYDEVVEGAYARSGLPLTVFSSNFDFTVHNDPNATKLFKIHGTLNKDSVDGHSSRMILTDMDYDLTLEYREALYSRLASDLAAAPQVVIIGQSLADPDLREVVQKAIEINRKAMAAGRIALLLYTHDDNRASLFEARGLRVAFGSIDDFFIRLAKKFPDSSAPTKDTGDLLDLVPGLRPVTLIVEDETNPSLADVSAIFNGWPARYSDIARGYTFDRRVSGTLSEYLRREETLCAVLLGASGVGKTTAARQSLLRLRGCGFFAWEHKGDHPLNPSHWLKVAEHLSSQNASGVLFIDEAQSHLYQLNEMVDRLSAAGHQRLKLLLVSSRNHWGPRIKTPNLYARGKEFSLSQLSGQEIDSLLTLVETVPAMRQLVESGFGGFSRYEQRRRLVDRCEADMFVCLKNIFATEKFDDIILREYAGLAGPEQDIYRLVAAMEHAGIRVHRQLVIRLLCIDGSSISAALSRLAEIIHEYDVNVKEGIYGWRVRHPVIAGIIARYKFSDTELLIDLFEKVIAHISPTYDIEIRTIRELCNIESGLAVIPDKRVQNNLLRRMMSIAPGERVPRHRLIRNLIELGEFEKAESEIRIFEKDFRQDGPVVRYRILLMIARATQTPELMNEDRVVILNQAREFAASATERYETNKTVLGAYCELGIATFKFAGSYEVYDEAIAKLKRAEGHLGDPEITKMIVKYQRRISGHAVVQDGSPVLADDVS